MEALMSNKNDNDNIQFLPIGMCLGISIGMAIGAAFDNIPIGMCLGVGCGSLIGSLLSVAANSNKSKKGEDDTDKSNDEEQK